MRRYGILKQEDYRTTEWSGGKTTQLAIWPEGAVYGDRNFGWRVSSATVETPESDFTPVPDYDRHLMMLKGDILIRHNGGEWKSLPEGTPYFFDGADHTESRGEAVDFNLMLRKGQFDWPGWPQSTRRCFCTACPGRWLSPGKRRMEPPTPVN